MEITIEITANQLPQGYKKTNKFVYAQNSSNPMVLVSAGYIDIGSDSPASYRDEKPLHEVYLDSFLIDVHKVTREDYRLFLNALKEAGEEKQQWIHPQQPQGKNHIPNDWRHQSEYPYHAVTGIDWFDAWAYANWIGKALPTEAQWEKTCKTYGEEGPSTAVENMQGKGWEWCLDDYKFDYYSNSPLHEPCCQEESEYKVTKGGTVNRALPLIRSSFRNRHPAIHRDLRLGFRCVKKI